MPASGEAISDSSVDKSLEASNSLSNPPLTPPSYSGTDTDLQIRRSCACPLHRNPEPSSPSPAAAARRPTDTQPRGPFAGMVFGVLPEQWDLEVLSIVQRMIVVSMGILGACSSAAWWREDPPARLLHRLSTATAALATRLRAARPQNSCRILSSRGLGGSQTRHQPLGRVLSHARTHSSHGPASYAGSGPLDTLAD